MHNTSIRQLLILLMLTFSISLPKLAALPISEKRMEPDSSVQRIVSLSPNVTETLYALGAGNRLVGRSDYCNYPEQALALPSIGTLYNPSLEKLLSLEPTLVISSAFVSDELLGSIRQAGIEVLSLQTDQTVQGTYQLIREIAEAVEKQKEAELLILTMQNEIRAVYIEAQHKPKKSVYVVLDFVSFDATATGDTFLGR
jgi:iron complex transport system substrate-binding protein